MVAFLRERQNKMPDNACLTGCTTPSENLPAAIIRFGVTSKSLNFIPSISKIMKTKTRKPATLILAIMTMTFICLFAKAQVPPPGKYNTTNYPDDRKAIEALRAVSDSSVHLNDDYIAVGPEGKVSYGFEQWKKCFTDNNFTFKSVKLVPGTYILRVYNGDAAVKTLVLDVVIATPGGDIAITVIRTETYIKENGKWYFVSGQGTKKATAEEKEKLGTKILDKN